MRSSAAGAHSRAQAVAPPRPGASKKTLRELTREGATIKLLAGRYGPYVTDGSVNASLPKTADPNALTFEQTLELLAARRDMAPAPKRGFKRKAAGAAAPRAKASKRKTS